jgi:hypothetical protein
MTITVPDHFKEWLEGMHPRMYGFIDFRLPSNILKDFSREALRQFEVYLLDMWPDPESFDGQADWDFKDGATRYVGEAYLREFGGGWFYTDDPEALFPGRPCVVLDVGDDFPMSPYNLMTTALKRRTGQVLVKVWDGQLRNVEEMREKYGPNWKPRRKPVPGITEGTDAEEAPKPERDAWVAGLDGRIAALRERVGTDAGSRLDLSVASLPLLEELVLADFPDENAVDAAEHREVLDQYASYLGETLRRDAGGEWVLRPARPDSNNMFLGRPYVERWDNHERITRIPYYAMLEAVRDRSGQVFQRDRELYRS